MRSASEIGSNRTKLVATLGPAVASPERLSAIFGAGVDVCRLNFSHGDLAAHGTMLAAVRACADALGEPIAVLGDLCGPKIRLNLITGGAVELAPGAQVQFVRGSAACTAERFTVNYPRFLDEVDVGHRVYIDDGLIRLLATQKTPDAITCVCTVGGAVSSRKGVNLPDTRLSVPALTEKDLADLDWAIENGLDYVALSFARTIDDLKTLKRRIAERSGNVGVIVKIEKMEALEHLAEFVHQADGIMVARGDLGVEMDVWQVPIIQKTIVSHCRRAGKPVIVATQMLQSMISNPMPTRAEVSDVANAIFDEVDAVMLSAETAAGSYPLESVEMIGRVGRATEALLAAQRGAQPAANTGSEDRIDGAVASAAVQAALHIDAKVVAVWTASGQTARTISRHRLPMPVVALTADARVARRLVLYYGLIPVCVPPCDNPVAMARQLDALLIERRLADAGDVIVVVTSTRPDRPGTTDTALIHRVGA